MRERSRGAPEVAGAVTSTGVPRQPFDPRQGELGETVDAEAFKTLVRDAVALNVGKRGPGGGRAGGTMRMVGAGIGFRR